MYALGCAAGRAFPRYSRSSKGSVDAKREIQIGFIFVGDNTQPLDSSEVECLKESCEGELHNYDSWKFYGFKFFAILLITSILELHL